MTLDVDRIKRDFPIFRALRPDGKPLIYLDNAATTQKPASVIETIHNFYRSEYGTVHRGIYQLSAQATERYEAARQTVADFIGAASTEEIIFTRGTTESINLVSRTWGEEFLKAGDEIILSEFEHHSNLVPWQMLMAKTGIKLVFAGTTPDWRLDLVDFRTKLSPRTKLVAITGMSNVLGTMPELEEIIDLSHSVGARVLIDGAQLVPHDGFDVRNVPCDFLAFSGHKMLGPTGIGVLYMKRELGEITPPWLGGGDMIEYVEYDSFTTNVLPYKFEAGTPDFVGAIALAAAIDYLESLGLDNIRQHEREITEYALGRFLSSEGLTLYGPHDPENRGAVFSFNYGDIHSHDVATILDGDNIALRAGHHCAQPLMKKLGVGSTARASAYVYNEKEDIDILLESLKQCSRYLTSAVG